jgi:hypothetical protein
MVHGSYPDGTRTAVTGPKVLSMDAIDPSVDLALAEARRKKLSDLVVDIVDDLAFRSVCKRRLKVIAEERK